MAKRMTSKSTSKHEVDGEFVEVKRKFKPEHVAAGYHLQVFGEPSHDDHELLGQHGNILIEHVEDSPKGAGGPEFLLTWPDGSAVTVLCADTVRQYLKAYGEE